MGIFSSIKDAIFGRKKKAQPQAQQPQTQAPRPAQQQQVAPQANQAAQPAEQVDVDEVLADLATEKGQQLNYKTSIVDLMKLLDLDPSLTNRKELAEELGYTGARDGSAEMNIWLHKAVMKKLEENGGKVSADLRD
jgi:hypothetical protein